MARIDIKSAGGSTLSDGVLQLENGVAMDTTLRNVADQNNTTSPLKLSTTAVQVVSPLRITTDDPSDMYLDCEDGATNNRFNITRNTASQQVNLNFASNPVGSTSIVGGIRTFVDGVNLSEVMAFREDGQTFVTGNTTIGNGTTAIASRLAIKGSGSTSATTSLLVQNSGGTQLGYVDDSGQWMIGTGTNGGYKLDINGTARIQSTLTMGSNITFGANDITINSTKVFGKLAIFGTATGTSSIAIGYTASATTNAALAIGYNAIATGANATVIGESASSAGAYSVTIGAGSLGVANTFVSGSRIGIISNVYFGSGVRNSGSSVAGADYTINGSGASNNFDIAGGNLILAGGKGTGAGTPGDVILSTPTIEVSSNTLQTLTNRWWIKGTTGTLANVSIPNASAILQADSTTQGFLPPRMTDAQIRNIATPAEGLVAYNTTISHLCVYQAGAWVKLSHSPM